MDDCVPEVIRWEAGRSVSSKSSVDHIEMVESVMLLRGSHQFGFGGSSQRVTLDSRLADRLAGAITFPTFDDFTAGRPDVFL